MNEISALHKARYEYKPEIPEILNLPSSQIIIEESEKIPLSSIPEEIKTQYRMTVEQPVVRFKKGENPDANNRRRIGVLLSGGQAPGGHNVIAGLFDGVKEANPDSKLYGFKLGPAGLVSGDYEILTSEKINQYRNSGGFDIIGSGRTKIETDEQIEKTIHTVEDLELDALVIIGGDDSNTNAAFLAEIFKQKNIKTQVIGVPKTIDGDLKNKYIETSFGFDTASKVYSDLIGDLERDTMSAKKYWNVVKLMGRSASHIALECALQTHPNICLIGEEIQKKNMSLQEILYDICQIISERSKKGENFGVILIPEGIVEFIPETAHLIEELNKNWVEYEKVFTGLTTLELKKKWLEKKISQQAFYTLCQLPDEIAEQFLGLRDPHGNILVSQIETEKLFIMMMRSILEGMKGLGKYKGTFSPVACFYGYEGRSVFPSNFDANYCYALGKTAFNLITNGVSGCIANVRNLSKSPSEWECGGVPLTMMMDVEIRKGVPKAVIKKSLVDLDAKPFSVFREHREDWAVHTSYVFPGPIQYFGPSECCNRITETLKLESMAKEEK